MAFKADTDFHTAAKSEIMKGDKLGRQAAAAQSEIMKRDKLLNARAAWIDGRWIDNRSTFSKNRGGIRSGL